MSELKETEVAELRRFKAYFPFREWFAVKTASEFQCFDSKRKALNFARKHVPATVYAAQ